MSLSMTGFGRAVKTLAAKTLSMEIRSVNSRYFDLKFRSPAIFAPFEASWRKIVQEEISRGKLELRVNYLDESEDSVKITADLVRAKAYAQAYESLATALAIPERKTLDFVSSRPDVFHLEDSLEDEQAVAALCEECLRACLADFHSMRRSEAAYLEEQLLAGLQTIEELHSQLLLKAPTVPQHYKERLLQKISEMAELRQEEFYDGQRVAAEIAIFADKADVTEELQRLKSHVAQFRELLTTEELVGKKLDFLVQEMNREANTLASKSQDIEMTRTAVRLKSEIEKLREQIQNLE